MTDNIQPTGAPTSDGILPIQPTFSNAGIEAAKAATPSLEINNPALNPNKKKDSMPKVDPKINETTSVSLNVEIIKELDTEPNKRYFVKLPHSGYEFNVRGLLVEEEDMIKSSNTSTKRAAETIMKVLYNCISNDIKTKDHPFGRYETFISNISLADRDTLVLAVIEQTYESTHDMNIRCNKCGKNFVETVCLPNCITYNHYTGAAPILQKRHILEFPELKWKMYLKIPTVLDEIKTLNTNQMVDDLQRSSEYIFIDKLEYTMKTDRGDIMNDSISNPVQIYGMIKTKPAIIRKRIEKAYERFRGDWGVTGQYETVCKYCESPIIVNIIPISHFLYMVQ